MRVIAARNVHQALPRGLQLLDEEGIRRDSRNGEVVVAPWPVTTVYERPAERVIFWPQRDANPALHLYESLWMLAGREDVGPLTRYAARFSDFSDDGTTMHGAYGHRWRREFGHDQLLTIAERLRTTPDDRRCVLQMWSTLLDLGGTGKDVPCNVMATLQRGATGALDLAVFCRSNDVIWGCYGANAVHFSLLQEYLACLIGCPIGSYTQVSVNWHAYLNVFQGLAALPRPDVWRELAPDAEPDPYTRGEVKPTMITGYSDYGSDVRGAALDLDERVRRLLSLADDQQSCSLQENWEEVFAWVFEAHRYWRTYDAPERFNIPLELLRHQIKKLGPYDWLVAMMEWIERRQHRWQEKTR